MTMLSWAPAFLLGTIAGKQPLGMASLRNKLLHHRHRYLPSEAFARLDLSIEMALPRTPETRRLTSWSWSSYLPSRTRTISIAILIANSIMPAVAIRSTRDNGSGDLTNNGVEEVRRRIWLATQKLHGCVKRGADVAFEAEAADVVGEAVAGRAGSRRVKCACPRS